MRNARIGRAANVGFTLVELMIVVGVIAILASIAYPTYQDSVRKGRRGQAKADLVEAAQIMERFRTSNATFEDATGFLTRSPKTGTAYYAIALSNDTATTFTLTATPAGDQLKDRCGALRITHTGAKFHEKGSDADCQFGMVIPAEEE